MYLCFVATTSSSSSHQKRAQFITSAKANHSSVIHHYNLFSFCDCSVRPHARYSRALMDPPRTASCYLMHQPQRYVIRHTPCTYLSGRHTKKAIFFCAHHYNYNETTKFGRLEGVKMYITMMRRETDNKQHKIGCDKRSDKGFEVFIN
uniref:Secreted protein n=1 Tax=Panagrellus redivivus TaxID=6233 RepID=A0A7E4ZRC0_PANRE